MNHIEEMKQTLFVELLEAVPVDARLSVDDGPYSTTYHPVGRLCHEAAVILRQAIAEAEKQEPVAECVDDGEGGIYYRTIKKHIGPLYAFPPQKEWVGLTNEEILGLKNLPGATRERTAVEMAFAVQEKLKQKNGYAEEKNT
jgi:hypothetical protein